MWEKRIPWIDICVGFGLPLLATAACIGVIFTPQEFSKAGLGVGIASLVSIWGLGSWWAIKKILYEQKQEPPTFELFSGCWVWTNGIEEITRKRLEYAINFFMKTVPTLNDEVSVSQLYEMFDRSRMTFDIDPIKYGSQEKNGLQNGFVIKVRWLGGFKNNAFFHECVHMVRDVILNRSRDYKHEDRAWWDLVPKLKEEFDEDGWKV